MCVLNVKTSFGRYRQLLVYSRFILLLLTVYSCKSYQANILFTVEEEEMEELSRAVVEVEENYLVSPNDHLQIEVYTNKGEELIDPNNVLKEDERVVEASPPIYVVQPDGTVYLPIVGATDLAGMTLVEVDRFLEQKYQVYYKDPFVQTKYLNKRVIVLGGTEGKVIPLENEGMNLLEVLALVGGVDKNSKGNNIRLIRGDLKNPQVHLIDLSSIEGMSRANLAVQPNDIIYIEPVRMPFTEGLKDVVPILGLLTSILALIIAINN